MVVVVVAFIQSGGHKTKQHIKYVQEYSPNESQYSKQQYMDTITDKMLSYRRETALQGAL